MKRALRLFYTIFIYACLALLLWAVGYITAYNVNRWIHRGDPRPTIRPAPTLGTITGISVETAAAIAVETAVAMTPQPTATPSPVPSLTPTGAPTTQPALSQPPALALIPADDLRKESTYHNAILFSSYAEWPFHGSNLESGNRAHTLDEALWLLKLDTLSAASLTPPRLSSAASLSAQGAPQFINFGAALPTSAIHAIAPPAECVPPPGWNGDEDTFPTCTDFQFSPDGNFLGYQILIHGCSSQLRLIDLRTSTPVMSFKEGGHFLNPLPNGRWLYATGSCGGGTVAIYDPLTNESTDLGPEAMDLVWNPQRSAFYAHVFNEGGQEVALWGYNVETGQVFLSMDARGAQYQGKPTWTPDGQALIFQYREGAVSADRKQVKFTTPRQLIRLDIATHAQAQIADPAADLEIAGWAGDFLRVGRYPFKTQSFDFDTLFYSHPDPLPPVMKCITQGEECGPAPEWLGYNYRTGELEPWAETGLPAATVTPGPGGQIPALDLAHPLYEDPGGAFQVVLGPPVPASSRTGPAWKGFASLWYVPRGGGPLLWVETGRGFYFVP